ncbi:hypothetical protein C1G86_0539 [Dehalococcoides mccartyi]|uniref:Uncharacterized protein n=1 Tax=Dehalococcoides mccartyi TaxID=61435 RepID=A0A142V997_9CHLR|nr:hypothetical protein Dm11a5_0516 [Dehalococcoides mccartyi]RAL69547.1 hypothetical protein C1G87_0545 [Dehalococcoides mccartyi]RAL70866.1 hypothetical protein C1G86_0539 [Dehalococcoides mccartyi]
MNGNFLETVYLGCSYFSEFVSASIALEGLPQKPVHYSWLGMKIMAITFRADLLNGQGMLL